MSMGRRRCKEDLVRGPRLNEEGTMAEGYDFEQYQKVRAGRVLLRSQGSEVEGSERAGWNKSLTSNVYDCRGSGAK